MEYGVLSHPLVPSYMVLPHPWGPPSSLSLVQISVCADISERGFLILANLFRHLSLSN